MARTPRIVVPGFVRHVMARGNGKMHIFLDDEDYRRFISLLSDVVAELDIVCWNYCVMPNHYHVTLQPTRSNLSQAIQHLNSVYGGWWNRRHGRVGHVFQGRFKDQVVDRDTYLLTLTRYVARNPVRAGLADRPERWPWGSFRAIAGLSAGLGVVSPARTLELFGKASTRVLQERFIRFVDESAQDPLADERIRSNQRILGPDGFRNRVLESPSGTASWSDPGLTPV